MVNISEIDIAITTQNNMFIDRLKIKICKEVSG